MTEPQAFMGDYVDLKFIKTRKVAQVHIEIPIENAAKFIAAFGAPNPASGIPIAMARIDKAIADKPKGGKLCQRAGILSNEPIFAAFMGEHYFKGTDINVPDEKIDAAYMLRNHCGIQSRSELDHNPEAARKFLDLVAQYEAWKLV